VNIAEIAQAAFAQAPAEVRQWVTFTDDDGNTARGQITAVAGTVSRATDLDGFMAGASVSERTRRLTLMPEGLDGYVPLEGHTVELADESVWRVVGCTPLAPGGVLVYYRVKVVR
jgi:hypothetical protein